jgi:hypothetical protein
MLFGISNNSKAGNAKVKSYSLRTVQVASISSKACLLKGAFAKEPLASH